MIVCFWNKNIKKSYYHYIQVVYVYTTYNSGIITKDWDKGEKLSVLVGIEYTWCLWEMCPSILTETKLNFFYLTEI